MERLLGAHSNAVAAGRPPVSGRTPRVLVRPVKGGIELRVDGTLASFRSTSGAPTGTVWWTLAAPVVLVTRARPRVLLLGLGAGSVAARLIL